MDPLGPLGESSNLESSVDDGIPSPLSSGYLPPKGPIQTRASLNTMMTSVNLDDEDDLRPMAGRGPPAVQPASPVEGSQRQNQPSVSIVEAAKPPFFHITVGDPHKVGDLTSAHTEYQVYTKVFTAISVLLD
jgi:sorting nexin-1/2